MTTAPLHVVTGAFGYSGRRIALRLLEQGARVRTLTHSPQRGADGQRAIETVPYHFDDPDRLTDMLRGASVLYNTYWIRYNQSGFTRAEAIRNSLTLFEAARRAGVPRIVHVSIANPSEDSPFEYYAGKARLERAVRESGLSYAILRPAVLFGDEDILINNIAWMLRHLPVFGIFGDGAYGIRPIHVDDFAELAVAAGASSTNEVIDAVGPERFAYRDLVSTIAGIIGVHPRIIRVAPELGYWIGRAIGLAVGDMVLTRDEIGALMAGLLDTDSPATGRTLLTEWARTHADTLGRHYASELARRRDRTTPYAQLS